MEDLSTTCQQPPKKRNDLDTEAADQAACSAWAVEASLRSPNLLNQVRARGLGRLAGELAGQRPLLPVGLDEPGVAGSAASKLRVVVGKGSGVVGNSLQLLSQGLRVLSAGFQFGSLAGSSDLVPDGAGRISAASAGGKAALGVSVEHG